MRKSLPADVLKTIAMRKSRGETFTDISNDLAIPLGKIAYMQNLIYHPIRNEQKTTKQLLSELQTNKAKLSQIKRGLTAGRDLREIAKLVQYPISVVRAYAQHNGWILTPIEKAICATPDIVNRALDAVAHGRSSGIKMTTIAESVGLTTRQLYHILTAHAPDYKSRWPLKGSIYAAQTLGPLTIQHYKHLRFLDKNPMHAIIHRYNHDPATIECIHKWEREIYQQVVDAAERMGNYNTKIARQVGCHVNYVRSVLRTLGASQTTPMRTARMSYTPRLLAQVRTLYLKKIPYKEICDKLGLRYTQLLSAIRKLKLEPVHYPNPGHRQRLETRYDPLKERITAMLSEKQSVRAIAHTLSVDYESLSVYVRRYNLRSSNNPETLIPKTKELYQQGWTIKRIADHLNINASTLRCMIRRHVGDYRVIWTEKDQ